MNPPDDSRAVRHALRRLAEGRRLGEELATQAFRQVMHGEATPSQTGALLMGLRVQGEQADEVMGVVRAIREAMVPVAVSDPTRLIDTCGTGGGSVSTFNISTAAAFVAVGGGATVAKHGNRSFTSRCGSADLLEALDVPIDANADRAAHLLREVGMAFLFAPFYHPATGKITPIRQELAVPTIMNLIGPLANPAGVRRQVVGAGDVSRASLLAEVLARFEVEHALVFHARVGMDEISPVGETDVWEVRDGHVERGLIDPATYGLSLSDLDGLAGGAPRENAQRVARLLRDPGSDPIGRAAVGLNAGAALYVAGLDSTMSSGVEHALAMLDQGTGAGVLDQLRRESKLSTSE